VSFSVWLCSTVDSPPPSRFPPPCPPLPPPSCCFPPRPPPSSCRPNSLAGSTTGVIPPRFVVCSVALLGSVGLAGRRRSRQGALQAASCWDRRSHRGSLRRRCAALIVVHYAGVCDTGYCRRRIAVVLRRRGCRLLVCVVDRQVRRVVDPTSLKRGEGKIVRARSYVSSMYGWNE
jgi:hypothetical protein